MAERISAVFAREVEYADLPVERAREQMLSSGLTPWQVEGMLEWFAWIRSGAADSVTADVREVTGADARRIEDRLDEFRGAFLTGRPSL